MAEEYLNYIELLENTLASFYEKLKNKTEFDVIKTVLEFMETHSIAHAEQISDIKVKYTKPLVNVKLITDFQNQVTNNVTNQIEDQKSLTEVLQILANAEGELGDLYNKFSDHLEQLSKHYHDVASAIKDIAQDEYGHKNILLRDKEQLEKKSQK